MATILICMITILICMATILICMITILICMIAILICMVAILICMIAILICMVTILILLVLIRYKGGGGVLSSEKYRYIEEKYLKKNIFVSGLGPKVDMTKMNILAEFGSNTIKTGVSGFFCMIYGAYSVLYLKL